MKILHRYLNSTVSFAMLLCFASGAGAAVKKSPPKAAKEIVLDKQAVQLEPNQSIEIRAKVLDRHGRILPGAGITWKIPEAATASIEVRPIDKKQTHILIVAKRSGDNDILLEARSGSASNIVDVTVQKPIPNEIVFPNGNKVELPVQGHKTIRAYVLDGHRNAIDSAEVVWSLADPDHEAFVLVGPNVRQNGVNEVEIAWLGGKADLKPPPEVKLIARSGNVHAAVTIQYAAPKPEATKVLLDPKEITVRPGESVDVQVVVRSAEDDRILKVEPEAEIADVNARSFIRVMVADKKTITVAGSYGDDKSPPPDFLRTALVVKAANGIATIPVIYRRDAATVDWDILPPNIVGDNYGRTIKKDYYCIEVRIQNNSGADLALAGLGFQRDGITRPNTSYTTVHGSLARRKLTHPRTMTLAILDGLGTLMTGFNPFFHDLNHAKNYSQFIDILSNPLIKGLEKGWMDSYPDELARFEQDVIRDDKIIPNGSILKTKIFFPKRALFENGNKRRDMLGEVRKELGTLWVLAYKFQKGPVQKIASTP